MTIPVIAIIAIIIRTTMTILLLLGPKPQASGNPKQHDCGVPRLSDPALRLGNFGGRAAGQGAPGQNDQSGAESATRRFDEPWIIEEFDRIWKMQRVQRDIKTFRFEGLE